MTKLVPTYKQGDNGAWGWGVEEESGGGGSLPFPAQAGGGHPNGSVTPTGIGSVYVDTTNGGIYIAVGTTNADWILVGGADLAAVAGVGTNGARLLAAALAGNFAALTDTGAWAGTGNGIYWNNANAADGSQQAAVVTGSSGQFETDFRADGVFDTSGAKGIKFPSADPHVAGAWWDNAGTLTRSAG